MRRSALFGAIFALAGTFASAAYGFDYESFKPNTLARAHAAFVALVKKDEAQVPFKTGDGIYDEGGQGWSVRARYLGRSRPLTEEELKFVRNWLKSVQKADAAVMFVNAYLFQDAGVDYWLPVEAPVAKFFPKELKVGQAIDLYMIEVGGIRSKRRWLWLPFVEEFRKTN